MNVLAAVVFPLMFGAGLTMYTDGQFGAFVVARICFAIAALSLLVPIWVYSSKKIDSPFVPIWILGATDLTMSVAACFLFSLSMISSREDIVSTTLWPANEPDPDTRGSNCVPPKQAFKIFLGSSMSWASEMPHSILRVHGEDLLRIDKIAGGDGISISLVRVFDDRKDIAVRIEDSSFWLREGNRKKKTEAVSLYLITLITRF